MTPADPYDKKRTIRVKDDLWDRATAKAASENTTIAAVIRAALTRYVGKQRKADK